MTHYLALLCIGEANGQEAFRSHSNLILGNQKLIEKHRTSYVKAALVLGQGIPPTFTLLMTAA